MYTKYIVVTSAESGGHVQYRLNKLDGNQDTQDTNWDEGDKLVNYQFVQNRMSKLLGQVLTVIDASISEKNQNKAVKDIIKNTFVDEYVALTDMLFDKSYLERSCNNVPMEDITEVTTDEALGVK